MGNAAVVAKANILGTYNKDKAAFQEITAKDDLSDYVLVFDSEDQYGNAVTPKNVIASNQDTSKSLYVTVTGGLTGITYTDGNTTPGSSNLQEITIDGKNYTAIPLGGAVAATGDWYVSMIGSSVGVVANETYSVQTGTIIKSATINPSDRVTVGSLVKMDFTVIDSEGKEVNIKCSCSSDYYRYIH